MPKIRTKKIGNIEKSGILNQNFRKTLRDEQHLSNFVLRDIFHNSNKKDKDVVQYNDNDTIFFTEKNINSTLGIESKYFNANNKLIHTPNSFYQTSDNTFNVNRTVVSKDYHDILYENYQNELSTDRFEFFNENFITLETISASTYNELVPKTSSFDTIAYNFKKKEYQIKKDYEEININFNKQFTYMSFNKNTDATMINRYVKFPNSGPWNNISECCFYTGTNNTLYLDSLESNKTKFLGNIDTRSGDTINQFKFRYITHNPLTIYPDDVIGSTEKFVNGKSISNPISNFGFPYSNEYEGKNEVLVPASNFINEEFILEKVYVEFKLQNFAISNNQDVPCFNTLNFFILNQKEEINTNNSQYSDLFYGTTSDLLEIKLQTNPEISGGSNTREVAYRTRSAESQEYFRSNINFTKPFGESEYSNSGLNIELETGGQFNISNPENDINKSRELITSIKIANIGNKIADVGGPFSTLEGFDAVIQSDTVNSAMTSWDGQTVYDNIINNEFKTVKITKSVNSYNENNSLKRFSTHHVYPNQRKTRSGMDIRSGRSWIDNYQNVASNTNFAYAKDKYEIPFDVGSENEISNPYVLKPKDNLIFGFNFAPSMLFNSDNISNNKYTDLTGRDVIVLDLSNLKIKLLGRYISEGKVFKPKLNEFENKNVKKINEFATNVVDKTGLPQQYALKGVYYDCFTPSFVNYPNAISNGSSSFSNQISIPTDFYNISAGHLYNNNMVAFGIGNNLSDVLDYYNDKLSDDEIIIDDTFKIGINPETGAPYNLNIIPEAYRFNVDHFGHFFDKVNNHRHKATKNTKSGKSTFNVTKKFRVNGLYTQKTDNSSDGAQHIINSYNKDLHARLRTTSLPDGYWDSLPTNGTADVLKYYLTQTGAFYIHEYTGPQSS